MALDQLTELAQSYLDVRSHLDPPSGARFGRFSADALRPHLAALKALTSALEELEPPDLDSEIDRTALLNDVRVLLFRCERERVFARDPAQWLQRVIDGAGPGRVADLPGFLDDAREALAAPVGLFAATALALLDDARAAVRHDRQALAALASFAADLERWSHNGPGYFAAGEDAFNFHLHYEHALRDTAPELWRYGHRLIEELKAGGAVAGYAGAAPPELSVPPEASLVRRMIRSPLTVDGWALYGDPRPERLLRHAVGVLLDVGLHTRGMGVAEGMALLGSHLDMDRPTAEALVRRTAAAPTYALTAAIGRRELLALRDAYAGPDFPAAVRPYGVLPVSLIRWGMGLGE